MAATGRERGGVVRCKAETCQQVIARVVGKTIRPIGDISIRDGRIQIVCPACGKRSYVTRADTEAAA